MRALIIALVLLVPALVHAGTSAPFLGKWKLEAVRTKDGPVPKDKLAGGGMTWEFKPQGALVMTVWKGKDAVTVNAKWTMNDAAKTITVDENGQLNTVTFKVVKKKLELAGTGTSSVVMTFARAKK